MSQLPWYIPCKSGTPLGAHRFPLDSPESQPAAVLTNDMPEESHTHRREE